MFFDNAFLVFIILLWRKLVFVACLFIGSTIFRALKTLSHLVSTTVLGEVLFFSTLEIRKLRCMGTNNLCKVMELQCGVAGF